MMIRDMCPGSQGTNLNDNMCVYLKGAPDRVTTRCSTVLTGIDDNGNDIEVPLDADMNERINLANKKFAGAGERVLAFSRKKLSPQHYNKQYEFDVKNWASWKDIKERPANPADTRGWFPMWNLQLVGLVSLNDPPRPQVDISVEKCKRAGIKVIMVTGDQPPTAAAIAHKVNIIKHPELEFNYLVE